MQNKQVLISPYVFPGLKLNGLSKKKYPFLKKAVVTITREEIVDIVLKGCEVTLEQLVSRCRERDIVDARKITCKVLKTKFNYSLKSIGDFIGGRDHTTVIHSITEFDSLYGNNEAFKAKADSILDKVGIEI
jgi:chromosomal replication initiator protein